MKIINKEGIDDEKASHKKSNIQRNKEQNANNQLIINKWIKNNKINYTKLNIEEKKKVELKDDESVRDIVSIKDNEEKKIEKYTDYIYQKFPCQIMLSMIKINFNDLKMELVSTENIKKQKNLKFIKNDKLREIQKQKRKKNKIENIIAFKIYIAIIIKIFI